MQFSKSLYPVATNLASRFYYNYDAPIHGLQSDSFGTSHLLFQLDIRILVCEPAKSKIIFKEEDRLVKAVLG